MQTTIPKIQRVEAPRVDATWLVPHKVNDPRVYPVVLGIPRDSWQFYCAEPDAKGKWPEVGELLPRVEEIRQIPGVGGDPDPRDRQSDIGSRRTASRRQSLEQRGWTIIEPLDARLPEPARYWACKVQGAGSPLWICDWDAPERVGSEVRWHVDHETRRAFLRSVASLVPPLSQHGFNLIRREYDRRVNRALQAAAESDVARERYERAVAIRDQLVRTWTAYSAARPPEVVRAPKVRL